MKTWIAENQLLAVVIGILILAGLIWLVSYLMKRYGKSTTNSNANGTNGQTGGVAESVTQRVVAQPTSGNRSLVGLGAASTSSMVSAPSGRSAAAGARVGGASGGGKGGAL